MFKAFIILLILSVPAWFTHIFTCFYSEQWGFLIAGAIMFPIAILHGWWIWITSLFHGLVWLFS